MATATRTARASDRTEFAELNEAPQEPLRLLEQAQRFVFSGPPLEALPPLDALATGAEELPAALRATAGWLRGVALGSAGRYGPALDVLAPLVERVRTGAVPDDEREPLALAAAAAGSFLRQLADHSAAEPLDRAGLALVQPLGLVGVEALLDCVIGLVADAVGLADVDTARRRLEDARQACAVAPPSLWRPRVRLRWVQTEVSLLAGEVEQALLAATSAVTEATEAEAPRHRAKSLMFLGVAQLQPAAGLDPELGVASLREAAVLAGSLGALPLVWPTEALLAASPLVEQPEQHHAAAVAAVRAIAASVPAERLQVWFTRDAMAAGLARQG